MWTVPVYVLPALAFALMQTFSILRLPSFHLTFLIPAIAVGVMGTLLLTKAAPKRPLSAALLGAGTGLVSAMLGAAASCNLTATAASEGRAWFGIVALPILLIATVTGLVIGIINSRSRQESR